MTVSAVFTPLSDSEIDAALSGAVAELNDIAQVQSKNLRLLQAVMRANLKGGLKNLLWLLCMHYNDAKDCAWPSIERLAILSLTEDRTVQRNLKTLVKMGLVVVGRVPGIRSNAFFINEDAVQAIAIDGISFSKNQLATVASKGDISAPKGDISSAKGDIFSAKGDAGVTLTEGTEGTEKRNGGGTDARATPPAPVPAPAPDIPVAPEPTPSPPSPAFFASQPQTPEQPTAVAEDASAEQQAIALVNNQRTSNGKTAFTLADQRQLAVEAAKAGISIVQAAEWILERSSRNFFRADYFSPPAPVAPTAQPAPQPQPVPVLTAEQQAAQEAAEAAARAKIKAMVEQARNPVTVVATQAPAQIDATDDTLVVPKTGHAWADSAIADALAGQTVAVRRLEMACDVAKVSYSDVRAAGKRAAAALTAIAA